MNTITGIREIDAKLKHLASRTARTIARKSVRAGNAEMVDAVRRETPIGPRQSANRKRRHRPGAMRRSVNQRYKKNRKAGVYEGLVGYNVGVKRSARRHAFHAVPRAIGHGRRPEPLGAVPAAYRARAQTARRAMQTKLSTELHAAVEKR